MFYFSAYSSKRRVETNGSFQNHCRHESSLNPVAISKKCCFVMLCIPKPVLGIDHISYILTAAGMLRDLQHENGTWIKSRTTPNSYRDSHYMMLPQTFPYRIPTIPKISNLPFFLNEGFFKLSVAFNTTCILASWRDVSLHRGYRLYVVCPEPWVLDTVRYGNLNVVHVVCHPTRLLSCWHYSPTDCFSGNNFLIEKKKTRNRDGKVLCI